MRPLPLLLLVLSVFLTACTPRNQAASSAPGPLAYRGGLLKTALNESMASCVVLRSSHW
jgi:hypothetical protein